eukprot:54735-Eustigmatos_ZCMA.PRE.1
MATPHAVFAHHVPPSYLKVAPAHGQMQGTRGMSIREETVAGVLEQQTCRRGTPTQHAVVER